MKISKLSPNFEVSDIKKTVAFYTENFGFMLVMAVPQSQDGIEQALSEDKEYVYAMMQKDNVEFMFQLTELKTTWYGMQEFYLKDFNGYILGFAEKAE